VVLLFLRVAGKLPLRHRISCVYINTPSLHLVNTASSHSSPSVARAAAPLDIMCLYQYLYFSFCQHSELTLVTFRGKAKSLSQAGSGPLQHVRGYPKGDSGSDTSDPSAIRLTDYPSSEGEQESETQPTFQVTSGEHNAGPLSKRKRLSRRRQKVFEKAPQKCNDDIPTTFITKCNKCNPMSSLCRRQQTIQKRRICGQWKRHFRPTSRCLLASNMAPPGVFYGSLHQ
jgi:hypothetical protein